MEYICTAEEAWPIADAVKKFLQLEKYNVQIEKVITTDVPYRTTLLATRNHYSILVDAQHKPDVDIAVKDLVVWLLSNTRCAELFIATDRAAVFSGKFFRALDNTGIGLMIVEDDGTVIIDRNPKNPALVVNPEPGLKFGKYAKAVGTCLKKFNSPSSLLSGDNYRKDALRDLCEIVEGQTEELAVRLSNKGHLILDEEEIRKRKWNDQINLMASKDAYKPNIKPFITEPLKLDLHSFRDARNKLDHKVRSKRDEIARQQQLPERMMMGSRLVADLSKISASVKRRKP